MTGELLLVLEDLSTMEERCSEVLLLSGLWVDEEGTVLLKDGFWGEMVTLFEFALVLSHEFLDNLFPLTSLFLFGILFFLLYSVRRLIRA